jgi:nitrite reductase/ring-hydroxylating ferredoxin subunit
MNQFEVIATNINDLQEGDMRQVSMGEIDMLLAEVNGLFYAVGAYCSHYQVPLVEGVFTSDHVVCLWHNA